MAAKVFLVSWVGRIPASDFLSALIITMNRIVASPCNFVLGTGLSGGLDRLKPPPYLHVERGAARSTPPVSFFWKYWLGLANVSNWSAKPSRDNTVPTMTSSSGQNNPNRC